MREASAPVVGLPGEPEVSRTLHCGRSGKGREVECDCDLLPRLAAIVFCGGEERLGWVEEGEFGELVGWD